ncbi:precorrin-6Y C5,15-methyltransferase (decarboxylating) subunit CbiT [Thermanaerosceptrum fracticalcis]|uniref:Precorrin-6Y C5,15-methyltransferase (Decarboxylating) subunit CbiT n=1 Tax=Thermanaerosceptrum fracticalcis TaxID=1712410 RepID=A0A7G6E0S2_THEFR|nr:precorrin-6Y C5,15-methyltransferase (decarboxylating) subunit CbiT [Thermanaerosceptrum fracticalcis]QNB45676.1 precorrin-6Y C5,15-methyltransferase (decarboxylating) subunit CbiT [Thermanaerosceptrum fracticalcis]
MFKQLVPGLPDDSFERSKVPMTKREIRILTLTLARIKPDSVIWDIGAGTGSLSVESALMAPLGMVYAIEKNPEACGLIAKNRQRFSLENLKIIEGTAPEVLSPLPQPDVCIVGGSGGNLKTILSQAWQKLKEEGRFLITAVTMETALTAIHFLEGSGAVNLDVNLVSVSKIQKLTNIHMFAAQNPVFIISAWKGRN